MTKRKCIQTVCACVCALISIFSFGACDLPTALTSYLQSAEEEPSGVAYALSEDKTYAKVVGYNGGETTVVIADTYQSVPVTRIDNDAFALRSIVSVSIPETVTTIGFSAFYYCTKLQQITLPGSLQAIGGSAFEHCDSLTEIVIPDSVITVGRRAFARCSWLTSVAFGSGVSYIGAHVFENSRNLVSVALANTNGWVSGENAVPADDLSNPATAARYLRITYSYENWTRS